MENFNIKRFGYTLRWLFSENRSRMLAWTAGLSMGIFVLQSLILWTTTAKVSGLELSSEIVTPICMPITKFCALVAMFLVSSQIFSTLKTKQKRIAYLTLPATNVERYLAALVMTMVVWMVCILLAVVLADVMRMVFFGIMGKGWVGALGEFFFSNNHHLEGRSLFVEKAFGFSAWLWTCSFYVLGAAWFRKREFLFTSLIQIVLGTAVVWLLVRFGSDFINPELVKTNENVYTYSAIFGFLALSVLHFWGSYQLFKRFQIITSKWTNL